MRRDAGTASVEAIAVVPFLLLAVLAAAQIGMVGQALWSAAVAARAGARAALVGGSAKASARAALPKSLRAHATLREGDGAAVAVAIPGLLPLARLPRVEAETTLDSGGR